MGYYTRHELETSDDDNYDEENKHAKPISEQSEYPPLTDATVSHWPLFEDDIKWYEMETDLLRYSTLHPSVIFTVTCHGEDDQHWRNFFKNGRHYSVDGELKFPKLNPTKLTETEN